MTVQQAAQQALEVQNACNLSGVVKSFEAILVEVLWPAGHQSGGTAWVNQHPISKLFASKISDLTRVEYGNQAFSNAYDDCEALAAGRKPMNRAERGAHNGEVSEVANG